MTDVNDLFELASEMRALKLRAKELRHRADEAKLEADLAEQTYYSAAESAADGKGVSALTVGGTQFVLAATTYSQVQDKEAFLAWAKAELPEAISEGPNKELLNAMVREALELGSPLPPGLGYYVKQYVRTQVAK